MSKDHFLPQFYLKRWVHSKDGRIVIFKNNPYKGIVFDRHRPEYTGYEDDLYKDIEEKFFKPLDNNSCDVLSKLECSHKNIIQPVPLDLGLNHETWAKFILSLIIRMPDKVNFVKEYFGSEDFALEQIPEIINNEKAVKDLRQLKWASAKINSSRPLLTSDRPLIFKPINLSHPNCVVILPLSPNHFFLATSEINYNRLEKNPSAMAKYINREVVTQAVQYVYASSENDVEINFLERYLRSSANKKP